MQATEEDFLAQMQNDPDFLEGAPHLEQINTLTQMLESLEENHSDITNAHYQEIMKQKEMQEVIHMLIRLVEPKLLPKTSPESINFFETDQFCLKPGSLLTFNTACVRSASEQ